MTSANILAPPRESIEQPVEVNASRALAIMTRPVRHRPNGLLRVMSLLWVAPLVWLALSALLFVVLLRVVIHIAVAGLDKRAG